MWLLVVANHRPITDAWTPAGKCFNFKLLLQVMIINFVRRSEQWDDRVADGCVQRSFVFSEASVAT